VGSQAVQQWLNEQNIDISWTSKRSHYLKASAPISTWETTFNTEFFAWEDTMARKHTQGVIHSHQHHQNITSTDSSFEYIRATEYSIPIELQPYVTAVFNTVQAPPVITNNYQVRKGPGFKPTKFQTKVTTKEFVEMMSEQTATDKINSIDDRTNRKLSTIQTTESVNSIHLLQDTTPTTVSALNKLYKIPSNKGNATQRQTVLQMSDSFWSPDDLLLFQQRYDLPQQAALDEGNFANNSRTSTQCNVDNCVEGNLDIQYISGIAQVRVMFH
jgi:hypothetical protein